MPFEYSAMKPILKYSVAIIFIGLPVLFFAAQMTLPRLPNLTPFFKTAEKYQYRIERDQWGIPHIYGKTDADTAFGLAYAHAEDDFATIQDVVLATRGKLAAVKGADAAKTDYLIAMMEVWSAVNKGYSQLSERTRALAESYADGLNLYAAKHPQQVSRYLLPVTGKDLVAGFTFKTPLFYGFDKVLGELMQPQRQQQIAISGESVWQFSAQPTLPTGSQGIAVAPQRSEDGHTRLLINSHQPLSGPVAWYEAYLHSEQGWQMHGGTFPGAPLILHGYNTHLGWANTVNKPDLVDVYLLTINPENSEQYLLDGQWQNFRVEQASIQVKLLGPLRWTFTRDIRFSAHGPVLETDHGVYAIRWAGMGETRMLEAMYKMNKAKSMAEFEAALAMQAIPSLNYVYADAKGNTALYYNAMFPKRVEGWNWQQYLPGDRSELIWQEYLPFDAMPVLRNPKNGLVYNANNSPFYATDDAENLLPADFSMTMGIELQQTNRALQIDALYSQDTRISADEFVQHKYDSRYMPGSAGSNALDALLAQQTPAQWQGTPYQQGWELLQQWDRRADKNSIAASIGMLTVAPTVNADFRQQPLPDIHQSFVHGVDTLMKFYGTVKVPFGEINRHVRGQVNLPISGGPDLLRAVYSHPTNEQGQWVNKAGDGLVIFVDWDTQGQVSSQVIHHFGNSSDPASVHYTDQMSLFTEEQTRP